MSGRGSACGTYSRAVCDADEGCIKRGLCARTRKLQGFPEHDEVVRLRKTVDVQARAGYLQPNVLITKPRIAASHEYQVASMIEQERAAAAHPEAQDKPCPREPQSGSVEVAGLDGESCRKCGARPGMFCVDAIGTPAEIVAALQGVTMAEVERAKSIAWEEWINASWIAEGRPDMVRTRHRD